ncbi:MAG: iron-containing alcohol dehydrogenase [Candidatus Omnitrophica bacterium]|nr:iron-containing alcohol dehydrogenase [Candidatus Omnitrophota bacterium]
MEFPQNLLSPQKVIFRKGSLLDLPREVEEFGGCGLILHGTSFEKTGKIERLLKAFPGSGSAQFYCCPQGEPTLLEISQVIALGKKKKIQWIAGIGGGSVLDLAKAAAGLFHAQKSPAFYQEGGPLEKTGIPFIAVPTTAGTGSEATPNAVVINPEKKVKLSIRDPSFMACKVILDPDLLKGLPPQIMAYSSMDAMVQGYESYISKNATWYTDQLALRAVQRIHQHLVPAIEKEEDEDLEALLIASYFAGTALASARLGVIHGIAHPLGVLYGLPHGLICAVCFIPSIDLNRKDMGKKYEALSQAVGKDFKERVEELLKILKITSPFQGKTLIEKEKIILETLTSGSTAANPKPVVREDVEFILRALF